MTHLTQAPEIKSLQMQTKLTNMQFRSYINQQPKGLIIPTACALFKYTENECSKIDKEQTSYLHPRKPLAVSFKSF